MKIFMGLVVVLLVGVGGYFFAFNNSEVVEDKVPLESRADSNPIVVQETTPETLTKRDSIPEVKPEPVVSAKAPVLDSKPTSVPPTVITNPVSIQIASFAFSPTTITVKRGTNVVWTNNDSAPHTVTGDNDGPASGTLQTGGVYSFIFNNLGTFNYHCSFHPSMKATVIVN